MHPVFQVFDSRLGTYIREATKEEALAAAASPSGVGATTDEGRECYVVPTDRPNFKPAAAPVAEVEEVPLAVASARG